MARPNRRKWVQHPHTGELIPEEDYVRPRTARHYVIGDEIPAMVSHADGKVYTSKSQYRRGLKQAGCVEVGNDPAGLRPPKRSEAPGLKEAVIEACNQHNVRY